MDRARHRRGQVLQRTRTGAARCRQEIGGASGTKLRRLSASTGVRSSQPHEAKYWRRPIRRPPTVPARLGSLGGRTTTALSVSVRSRTPESAAGWPADTAARRQRRIGADRLDQPRLIAVGAGNTACNWLEAYLALVGAEQPSTSQQPCRHSMIAARSAARQRSGCGLSSGYGVPPKRWSNADEMARHRSRRRWQPRCAYGRPCKNNCCDPVTT